jgi:hypothetical protein
VNSQLAIVLLEGAIPFVGGACALLVAYRAIGKKPGFDPDYDARMDRFSLLAKIIGPILMVVGVGYVVLHFAAGPTGPDHDVVVLEKVTDTTGDHQLVLRFIEGERSSTGTWTTLDFHSLAWEVKDGGTWAAKAVISSADFQKGARGRRWVCKLHSFDSRTGRANVQVGEEAPTDAAQSTHLTYSWREWDVANNREVRLIRVCENPYEPFEVVEGKGGSQQH